MATGWVWHEHYMWHNTGQAGGIFPSSLTIEPGRHFENAETKRRLRNLVEVSGLLDQLVPIRPRAATVDEIARIHDRDYIERVKALSDGMGGEVGIAAPVGPKSFEIAQLSAGGVMAACDAVMAGRVRNAYALVRPPGHHAERAQGMGFCLFCNGAVAIRHLQATHGVKRVAVVDWDVHHGNGTQQAFWDDPDVLTISVHQDRCFPADTGHVHENGGAGAEGACLNLPLPPGCGVGAYEAAFDRVVIPALHRFRPDFILVSCGFDAGAWDPLGRMQMHSDGYRSLTAKVMAAADALCGGRIVAAHEGGYCQTTVPFLGLAVIETMAGIRTGVEDPFLGFFAALGGQDLQPHQDAAIRAAEALLTNVPSKG